MDLTSSIKSKLKTLTDNAPPKKSISISPILKEANSLIYANKKMYMKNNKKENKIVYLEKNMKKDIESVYTSYSRIHICLYSIHFINNNPFLLYLFEKKEIDDHETIRFPIFKSNDIENMELFLEKIKDGFYLSSVIFKGYIENGGNIFLFFEYKKDKLVFENETIIPLTIHEICLYKKYYTTNICDYIIKLFFDNMQLMQLCNENKIPYEVPIICLYESDLKNITNFFGALKLEDSYYNFYSIENDFLIKYMESQIPIQKQFKRAVVFLSDSKFIFTSQNDINIDNLLELYDSIFISSKIYTEKTLQHPIARIIKKNNNDFIIL